MKDITPNSRKLRGRVIISKVSEPISQTGEEIAFKPEYILSKYPTFEYYLEQQSQFSTYALLTSDGIWHEPGRMGWFGCSTATSEDEIKYENEYKEKVLAEDPESYFVMVDCHI